MNGRGIDNRDDINDNGFFYRTLTVNCGVSVTEPDVVPAVSICV